METIAVEFEVISRDDAKASGLTRFFTDRPCKHGHIAQRHVGNKCCVECERVYKTALRATPGYAANRKGYDKARYAANPEPFILRNSARYKENTPQILEQMKEYREINKEKISRRNKDRYARRDKEAHAAKAKAYREANPEYIATLHRNRRALKRGAEGKHTKADVARIGAAQKWKCAWCGAPCKKDSHVDHIKPLILGGTNWPSNICISCPTCNLKKQAKHPVVWAQSIGLLL